MKVYLILAPMMKEKVRKKKTATKKKKKMKMKKKKMINELVKKLKNNKALDARNDRCTKFHVPRLQVYYCYQLMVTGVEKEQNYPLLAFWRDFEK